MESEGDRYSPPRIPESDLRWGRRFRLPTNGDRYSPPRIQESEGKRDKVVPFVLRLQNVIRLLSTNRSRHGRTDLSGFADCQRTYFFRRATTRTLRVCEIAPAVSASLMISACSCWCRFPDPVAGLALSDRPTYRT